MCDINSHVTVIYIFRNHNVIILLINVLFLQSLLKIKQTEPYYHQPAMESYEYDALFFIGYAQVRTSEV